MHTRGLQEAYLLQDNDYFKPNQHCVIKFVKIEHFKCLFIFLLFSEKIVTVVAAKVIVVVLHHATWFVNTNTNQDIGKRL